ncbi:hypothetical protein DBV05_g8613 [Lasiodiplodia theobromae]|uniref:Uncharacterized protein n=1 Tax=Lasiodiplodia theobromae TaxID=45133 RepID=A0A5N5D4R2_9PEZI|nr:hypothetical protein DBV05_g8613 [Lasiodiplodia theobromae]
MCASRHLPPAVTCPAAAATTTTTEFLATTTAIATTTVSATVTTFKATKTVKLRTTTAAGTTTVTTTTTTTTTATPTATPMFGTDGAEIVCPNRPADFDWVYLATDPLRAFNATAPSKKPPPADERDACLKAVGRAVKRFARHWHPDKAAIHPLHLTPDQLTAVSQHINKGKEFAEADCKGEKRPDDPKAGSSADTSGDGGGGGSDDGEDGDDDLDLDFYRMFGPPWSSDRRWREYEDDRILGEPVGEVWPQWNAEQVRSRELEGPSKREKAFWRVWKRVNKCREKEQPPGQYFHYWYQHGIYWQNSRLKQAYPYGWAPEWEMPPGPMKSFLLRLQSFIEYLITRL